MYLTLSENVSCVLNSTEDTVSSIAQAWNDEGIFIKTLINGGRDNGYIGMGFP